MVKIKNIFTKGNFTTFSLHFITMYFSNDIGMLSLNQICFNINHFIKYSKIILRDQRERKKLVVKILNFKVNVNIAILYHKINIHNEKNKKCRD